MSKRVVDRVHKLIERAKRETTPLSEREMAALRAVELIDKHNLAIGGLPVGEPRPAPLPPPPAPIIFVRREPPRRAPQLAPRRVLHAVPCSFCLAWILPGETMLVGDGLVIHDWPCKVAE